MHEEISIPDLTEVIARLAALLGPREGGVVPLAGGITNRNFRVNFGGTQYVVRLPGKDTELLGIDREAERIATRQAADLGLGPKVAAMLEEPSCLVTCFISSRDMAAEELREREALTEVARGLRAFHDSGVSLPTDFHATRIVRDYAEIVRRHGEEPPAEFDDALARADEIAKAVRGQAEHEPVACHNDLLHSNFLHDGRRIVIVDWEYAGMGDRFFDLGNFAVNNELTDGDEERLLEAYFGEPATPRRSAALKLFRFMSDLRESMWGVLQTSVSELDFDFEGYAAKHFERLSATGADERFEVWLREAGARDRG
jgi:thiamine kinase-like enzyme